jgi:hypothetical protein
MADFNSFFDDKKFNSINDKHGETDVMTFVDEESKGKLGNSYTNFSFDEHNYE